MTEDDRQFWPYLSPTQIRWTWAKGVRGVIRNLLVAREVPSGLMATDPPTVLDVLGRFSRLRQILEDDILGLVTEAHYRGVSWTEIAARLDRSKQSVHERYSRRVHATRTHAQLQADLREVAQEPRWDPDPPCQSIVDTPGGHCPSEGRLGSSNCPK